MKGTKKRPEPALRSLQSRGARVGDARAQPSALGAPLLSVGCDPADGPTRDRGDDRGEGRGRTRRARMGRVTRVGVPRQPFPHTSSRRVIPSPHLPPAAPLLAGRATLHPGRPLRAAAGVPARRSVTKRGDPKGAETFLQIGAAQRGRCEQSLAPGFLPAGLNISDSRRRGGG